MRLYIIRHGETEWNKVKRLQGQTDIPLAEEGIRLARLTGEGMRDFPIDFVISSPLERAVQTARLLTEGRDIPILTDMRIIEISFGEWEGECIFDSEVLPKEFRRLFYEDPMHCICPPGGETFADVCRRTGNFYQSLLSNPDYADKNILISTHGAAGRCLLSQFYEDKNDIWRGGVPKNCAVTTVEVIGNESCVVEKDRIFYEN
ncbi:MAG: histidine phosphatase family protein [Lachnospiraceae bacterium]|nr:histidine phosphatase family protein [Lachnospiraceae bacterium]